MKMNFLRLFCFLMLAAFISFPVIAQDNQGDNNNQNEVLINEVGTVEDGAQAATNDNEQSIEGQAAEIDAEDDGAQAATLADDDPETSAEAGLEEAKSPEENKSVSAIKEMRAEIKKLLAKKLFDKAGEKIAELRKYINAQKFTDERKTKLQSSVLRRETVALHCGLGHYQVAANAMRTAIEKNELKTDTGRLLKLQTMVTKRDKWMRDRLEHNRKMTNLLQKKQGLLEEKAKIVRKMDNKKKLSDKQFKALKAELKKINEKIKPLNEKIVAEIESMSAENKKMRDAGLILSEEKLQKLLPSMMKKMAARFGCYKLRQQIFKHLTNLAENNEIKWKGMEPELFKGINDLQDEIIAMKKELAALAKKLPLSDAQMKVARKIRRQIEGKMAIIERRLDRMEDGFQSKEAFSKLTAKEKAEYTKLFRLSRQKANEIEKLDNQLEKLYDRIFTRPGKVDPDPKPIDTADLEGDGIIIQEGNEWILVFKGSYYRPTNLPARYMINKLEVKFAASLLYRIMAQGSENATGPVDVATSSIGIMPPDAIATSPIGIMPPDAIATSPIGIVPPDVKKYPEITFTYVNAPQVPDEPFKRDDELATPTQVIEENIDNQDKPSNLMNAF